MSYILDALKKSEQERQQGTIPSISSQHRGGPPQRPKKPGWRSLIIIVLLLNACVFLWWLKPWRGEQEDKASLAQSDQQKEQPASTAHRTAGDNSGRTMEDSTPASPLVADTRLPTRPVADSNGFIVTEISRQAVPAVRWAGKIAESRQVVEEPGTTGRTAGPKPVFRTPSAGPIQSRPKGPKRETMGRATDEGLSPTGPEDFLPVEDASSSGAGDEQNDRIEQEEASPDHTDWETEDSSVGEKMPNEAAIASGDTAASAEAANRGKATLDYRQLPLSLREQLPELAISVLLYAKRPESRKVSIDGRMMREKEQIAKDLILEEITPDGVIFNFAGKRFHKKVFR